MRPKSWLKCFGIIIFFLSVKPLWAFQQIKYIGIEQGLSNNSVNCIFKDHYGFMWIGTNSGLNRYDGSKFKTFKNIWGNQASLSCNYISAITGLGNKILVGTQKDLVYYDYTDSKFYSTLYQPASGGKPQKVRSAVYSLVTDKSGNAYAATEDLGLLVFDKPTGQFKQIPFGNTAYTVSALTIDAEDYLWVFVKGTGLCSYDAVAKKIKIINNSVKLASCLLKDTKTNIWIGTENGLYQYNFVTAKLNRFAVPGVNLTSENIVDIKIDEDNKLWIATNGGGVNIFDTQSQKLAYIIPGEENGALKSGAISTIYEDNDHRKWIGTLRGGINVIEAKIKPFRLFAHDPFNKNSVINNFILSFCEDEASNIWIGTDGGGLSYWDVKNNTYTSYRHGSSASSLVSNFVVSIIKDYTNQIWVATFSGGIDAFDKATKTFRHYTCYNTVDKKEDKNLWKLFEDSKHNIWAGATRGGALYLFNRKLNKFELFDSNLVNVHALFEDREGNLWGGDYTRLIKIDRANKHHQFYDTDNAVRAIAQGAGSTLWIGTDGAGLLLFDKFKGTYTRYMQGNGLADNSVLNILVDNKDNLWCSTYNGLSCFNPKTKTFKNYDVSDGLQSNQFNYNAALKLKNGEMLFGGINGFNLFDPDKIHADIRKPQIRLTGLHINNNVFDHGSAYTDNQPVVSLKYIKVPYNQATIAIDYTALEYAYPDKINYAYYLEGWDHGWNYVGQLKTAYYTRLNEGTYTLHIKATDTGGSWLPNEQVIGIKVLPPWYRTWWAYLFYISLTVTIVYWFWLYRNRQTKLKYEVEIANIKVEREKELNEKKLSFFTNISHEFRTPLTLIINPIKDLLNKDDSNKEELSVIYRNARRLLGLVDHLLLFRKTESESTQMKVSKLNFANLCNDVFMCFTQQAKVKALKYELHIDSNDIEIYVDREKIEIVLFNLISNAIKFTPDRGSIFLSVFENENDVFVEIADNGIGIKNDTGDKLFSKFYQIKDKNYFKTGFGIGLYLVKVFIENHKGKISYHSAEGGGTTFKMTLSKGKTHFSNDQLFETEDGINVYVNDLIDHDNKEIEVKEEDTNNLELLISSKPSILVIDDNDQIRTYIKRIFVNDYVILEAADGQLGLELIKKHLPDIIVSDIVMDGLDGLELCRIVKQDSSISHIPIILLTGDSTPDIMLKSIEGGAVDFLSKPFEKEILLAKVKSVLRNKTELQNYFYSEITLKNSSKNVSEEHKAFLYNCIALIEHYMMEPDFDVQKVAREMAISYPTLYKKIKTITGQTVNNFIRFVRLRKAAELLIHTNCNVNEAAFQVGFNDIKYFREHFNKQFGINPSEFIKKHRTAFQISYRINAKVNPLNKSKIQF